jgi:CRISPR-associated endonuclease Cas2
MQRNKSLNLIMYDITHDKTLQKVAKLLQQNGFERINYSVWLGWDDLKSLPLLKNELQRLLRQPEAEGSRLYTMPVKPHTLKAMRSITGHKPAELDYWLGEVQNIFF